MPKLRELPSKVPGSWASNPNQDKLGDACDSDNDNDGLPDDVETTLTHTLPLNPDTDGDGVIDGSEVICGSNPLDNTSKCGALTAEEVMEGLPHQPAWQHHRT